MIYPRNPKLRHVVEKDWYYCGLRCIVIGMYTIGHRAGYVGVSNTHPYFKVDYDTIDGIIDVHGGLTYAGGGEYPIKSNLWWFGFDCGHFGDAADPELNPTVLENFNMDSGSIRTTEYVAAECEKLAEQLSRSKK
jgi:hypothetical protein